MDRREFFRKGASIGLAGAALKFGAFPALFRLSAKSGQETIYDMAAVKGGEPGEMFDKAIDALGGIKKFVKANQTVVIKPNIGWDAPPERAANTNPELIGRIIKKCYDAGAKKVYVFDHTCNEWTRCYKNSGIEKYVEDAGGTMAPGNDKSYYQKVDVGAGKTLKETEVHELILESDVFINVPVLKDHGSARVSIGMKNMMGNVWDRRYWHHTDLQQCIADFTSYRKPDLTVVDAYRILKKNGPRGVSDNDAISAKSLIISPDIVAADAAATKLFGLEPLDIPHIRIAEQMGLGTMELSKLNISRIKI